MLTKIFCLNKYHESHHKTAVTIQQSFLRNNGFWFRL